MCGIHGFTWKDPDNAIDRMVSAAAHRGPDGSGTWGDGRITLGHNLLSIADDPAPSAQPWHHAGGVLVYNGEVYNYRDLRKTLKHQCVTDSDTEVLAAGLAEQGPAFLKRVDGMFALAWYYPPGGELVLARDSNGAKPLYYGYDRGRIAFSSEVRSLLALGFDRTVSKEAFRHYYHSGLVAGPLTMFEGINKMLPGQVSRFALPLFIPVNRTNLNDVPPPYYKGGHKEIPGLLRQTLKQSVALTLTGKRNTGLFLSGGMDSAAVLYSSWDSGVHPETFSTKFELPHERCKHNEDAEIAAFLAREYGTRHRDVPVTEQDWVDGFEKAVAAMEEPRQGKSYAAYYHTYAALRRAGVVVTLSGDGGDELLLGYKHQGQHHFRDRLEGLRAGHRRLRDRDLDITLEEQVDYLDGWLPRGGLTGDLANDFMYVECLHTLSEDFLIRNDKLGAAFGMEARFPMMCKPFRDFCRSVPSAMKVGPKVIKGGWSVNNKYLLREAFRKKLPDRVTQKPKTGWRAPTDDWLIGIDTQPAKDGPARQYVRETLADPVIRDLFDITDETIENRYLNNREFKGAPKASGKPGVGPGMAAQKELFAVLMFAAWLKSFGMKLW
jgi:asparagine synthase (glutamine-hydrolysing)